MLVDTGSDRHRQWQHSRKRSCPAEVVLQFVDLLPIQYRRLERNGLVVARNASFSLAIPLRPVYLVFIDDEEIPTAGWLGNIVSRALTRRLDIAIGPVVPDFATPPPRWARDFFQESGCTFCTSNLVLRSAVISPYEECWFNPVFNNTGGEDNEFLNRLARQGAIHGIASNAIVSEFIPDHLLKLGFVLRHGLRDGVAAAQKVMIDRHGLESKLVLCMGKAVQKAGFGINCLSPLKLSHYGVVNWGSLGWLESDIRMRIA